MGVQLLSLSPQLKSRGSHGCGVCTETQIVELFGMSL